MVISVQERDFILHLLRAASEAIVGAPEVTANDKKALLQRIAEMSHVAGGASDFYSAATLYDKLNSTMQSDAFSVAGSIGVLLPGFGEGVMGTSTLPTGIIVDGMQTLFNLLHFISLSIAEKIPELRGNESTVTLPSEKVAPFHYSFDGGRLTVNNQPAGLALEGTIASAQALLIEQGARLIEELRTSNSDRRLREALEVLHRKVAEGQDIVQLGLLNITLEGAIRGAEAEISSILAEVLQAHTVGVRHYLAQFPEWVQFSDNAAELEVTREDLGSLNSEVIALANALEKQTSVDKEVPQTLRSLTQLHIDSPVKQRRAGLAIVRTLENLALSVFRRSASFALSTLDRSLDEASGLIAKALAGAIAITVLHVSATVIVSSDAAWLKPAAEMVLRSEATLLGK